MAGERGGRCLSKTFASMNRKLRWRCGEGHEWEAIPTSIKRGSWCPVCSGRAHCTLEEFKRIAKARGGECLSARYVNSAVKLCWKCAMGHRWKAVPSSVKAGTWCPLCAGKSKTIEDMRHLAGQHGGQCLSSRYAGSQRKLRWRCAKGHIWKAVPGSIQQGTWCPFCAHKGIGLKYSISDFKQLARKRGGDCLSADYQTVDTKVRWRCRKGHEWEAVPASIMAGTWCPFCAGRGKTIVDMHKLAERRDGKCLSKAFSGAHMKLRWQCEKGHEWQAVPASIKGGTWCPVCGGTQKRTIEEMKALAIERGGKCLSKTYVNIETKLLWECAEGHRWEAQPNNIRSGNWCPYCSSALAERICREYFEQLFGMPFPRVKPSWLRLDGKTRLELDGYCKELGLAFEHQGPHHYGLDIYSPVTNERAIRQKRRDRLKRLRCRKNGVVLISVPEIPTRLKQKEIKDFIRRECEKRGVALLKNFGSKVVDLRNAYVVPETRRQLEWLSAIAKEHGGSVYRRRTKDITRNCFGSANTCIAGARCQR